MGKETFDSVVKNKIIPISGDIISPDLSMSESDKEKIIENVNIVIHCAATLNYNERLDLALEVTRHTKLHRDNTLIRILYRQIRLVRCE